MGMNTVDIIRKWLNENGFDGLMNTEGDPCGCHLGDFMPCGGEYVVDCKAAYKRTCKHNPQSFCMVSKKDTDPDCLNCEGK